MSYAPPYNSNPSGQQSSSAPYVQTASSGYQQQPISNPAGNTGGNANQSSMGGGYQPSSSGGYQPSSTQAQAYQPSPSYSNNPSTGSSYSAGGYTSTAVPSNVSYSTPYGQPSAAAAGGGGGGGGGYQSSMGTSTPYQPSSSSTAASSSNPPPFSNALNNSYKAPPAPAPSAYQQTLYQQQPPPQPSSYSSAMPAAAGGGGGGGYSSSGPTTGGGYSTYNSGTTNKAPDTTLSYASNNSMPVMTTTTMMVNNNNNASGTYGPTNGVVSQTNNPTRCHKVDYEIKGSESQSLVEVHLDPGETVIAEAGGMMYLEDEVDFKAKFGDGSNPNQGFFGKLASAGGRLVSGESLFVTHFTNKSNSTRRIVAFAAPYPGTILPLDMLALCQQHPGMSAVIAQRDAFLCAAYGTKFSTHFNRKLGAGVFGGEGFILQKLEGDGMIFCHAGGCIIKKQLRHGETLRVDTGCLVAFTHPGIDYNIQMVKGLSSMFFGGEGAFLATLSGEGTVWLQSLPFSRLTDRILASARQPSPFGAAG